MSVLKRRSHDVFRLTLILGYFESHCVKLPEKVKKSEIRIRTKDLILAKQKISLLLFKSLTAVALAY
jgi:hypothetical protein